MGGTTTSYQADLHPGIIRGALGVTKLLFALAAFLLSASVCSASATNVYVAQNSVGAANGADCADAYSYTFFNNSANWGSGSTQIGPGTTVHLCGTFTGAANSTMLTAQGNGASGNPVTVLFETGAVLTAPYWSNSGAINIDGRSYIVISGGPSCGWNGTSEVACNGTIQNTQDCTTCAYQQGSSGVHASSTTGCEVKNLNIINIYVHTGSGQEIDQTLVRAVESFGSPVTNGLTVDHNIIHDCGWCVDGYGNNYTINNNSIYNMDHGIAAGNGASGVTISGLSFHDNHIHDMANWDTTGGGFHHDGIHTWGQGGGIINGMTIYNNQFDGTVGQTWTAWIFLEDNNSGVIAYNNVFIVPQGNFALNGAIGFAGRNGDANVNGNAAYNNIVIDHNETAGGDNCYHITYNTNFSAENNIAIGCNVVIELQNSTLGVVNNNIYDDSCIAGGNCFSWSSTNTASLATWQAACNCDSSAQFSSPSNINVNSVGHLLLGSIAIGAGVNLTSLGIPSLDVDKAGVVRPGTGAWDAGASQYSSSSATQPMPPTNLAAVAK